MPGGRRFVGKMWEKRRLRGEQTVRMKKFEKRKDGI